MVEKKIAGKTVSAIAREEGLSRDWVAHELASDECGQVITGLVEIHAAQIARLFQSSLDAIEDGLVAERSAVTKEGATVPLGADHYARLTAAKRLIELLTAGRATSKGDKKSNDGAGLTLEQLEKLAKQRQAVLQ
jgi:predicted transcriptional regulator